MIKASRIQAVIVISELMNQFIYKENIPKDWKGSFLINFHKGKSSVTDREIYRGLKLLENMMKGLQRVLESLICSKVDINSMQYGFMPKRSTADAIYNLQQMEKKHIIKEKKINSRVKVNGCFSERSEVTTGVHQGSYTRYFLLL